MTDEEKYKFAFECARKGIDLEEIEKTCEELIEIYKPIFDLSLKNKKILDKYDNKKS